MRSVFLLSGKHVVGNFVIRRGLRNQLVDNAIDSFRKGFEAGYCFLVGFGKVDFVTVNSFVTSQPCCSENFQTGSGNFEVFDSGCKRSSAFRADVVNQALSGSSEQRTCSSWGNGVDLLCLAKNFSNGIGHIRRRFFSYWKGKYVFFVNRQNKPAAIRVLTLPKTNSIRRVEAANVNLLSHFVTKSFYRISRMFSSSICKVQIFEHGVCIEQTKKATGWAFH